MIHLFTDYGDSGPYVGELSAVLLRAANMPVIDLMHDAPVLNPKASAYLLAGLAKQFKVGDACLAVVDPDVGLDERQVLIVEADGIIYCGPDNGLLSQVVAQAQSVTCQRVLWRPSNMSQSFHGRDLFAPVLLRYLANEDLISEPTPCDAIIGSDWSAQLSEIIYIDHFGNGVTGLVATSCSELTQLIINDTQLAHTRVFAEQEVGQAFWYKNSMGLLEIAMNQAPANVKLGFEVGTPVFILTKKA